MKEQSTVERSRVAAQLWQARKANVNEGAFVVEGRRIPVTRNRGLHMYLHEFSGLEHVLSYARTFSNPQVVDIGTGEQVIALTELVHSQMGEGIQFIGTELNGVRFSQSPYDRLRVIRTSAEVLRGIADESIAAITSSLSIAYSASPELTVDAINRVLLPGGIVKASFINLKAMTDDYRRVGITAVHPFEEAFKDKGYSSFIYSSENPTSRDRDILVAIKPGRSDAPLPKEIFQKDKDHFEKARDPYKVLPVSLGHDPENNIWIILNEKGTDYHNTRVIDSALRAILQFPREYRSAGFSCLLEWIEN